MKPVPVAVRPARAEDDAGIASVARATGQSSRDSGADSRYTAFLRDHGALLVAEADGRIAGYGATIGVGAASLLADLFIDPAQQGAGVGQALLGALWPHDRATPRFTFASQDPRAISLYARAGLTAWWPLLYLRGQPAALPDSALSGSGLTVARVEPTLAGRYETQWTGVDRTADLTFLSADAGGLVVSRDGHVVAAGVFGSAGLAHLAGPDPAEAADAVVASLRTLRDGEALVCLPGPHPAVPRLLAAGFRIADFDVFMATEPTLLATTSAYSPGLG